MNQKKRKREKERQLKQKEARKEAKRLAALKEKTEKSASVVVKTAHVHNATFVT